MRTVVIILAVIGGVFVLTIGSCVGCIGLAVYGASQVTPDHFTKEEISKVYGENIQLVAQALAADEDMSYQQQQFGDGVVAILHERPSSPGSTFTDNVYGRYAIEPNGHFSFNGAGVHYLEVNGIEGAYASYNLTVKGEEYIVAFKDWKPADAQKE